VVLWVKLYTVKCLCCNVHLAKIAINITKGYLFGIKSERASQMETPSTERTTTRKQRTNKVGVT
jgi:hypothetical protein